MLAGARLRHGTTALLLQPFQQLLQLARLVHLLHDVRAADELAVDVELRDGRPVGEFLDALADVRVLQHVDAEELLHAAGIERLHRERGKAALRELGRALHVEHHRVGGDLLPDFVLGVHGTIRWSTNQKRTMNF